MKPPGSSGAGYTETTGTTTDDGTIRLNLGQVVYVRTSRDEHKVGFGAA